MARSLNFILASFLVAAFVSCETQFNESEMQTGGKIAFVTPEPVGGDDTKTAYDNGNTRFLWAASDTIGIISSNGSQIFFPIKPEYAGTSSATFDGRGWALLQDVQYMAYYPFIGDFHLDYTKVPVSYIGQQQSSNGTYDDIGKYAFWVAKGVSPDDGNLNFTFQDVGVILRVDMPASEGIYDSLRVWLDGSSKSFVLQGTVDISAETPVITPILESSSVTIQTQKISIETEGNPLQCVLMMAPVNLAEEQIHLTAYKNDGTQVTSSFAGRDFTTRGYKYVNKSQLAVIPANPTVSADGGTLDVKVIRRSSTNPSYSAVILDSWITESEPCTTSGDVTTYHFSIGANTANVSRTGQIRISDATNNVDNYVTVEQEKAGYIVGVGEWDEINHNGKAK